jgi:hypothetical protein
MITGENGYPVDDLEIDVELRDKMVSHIQNRIIHNLEAIQKFLQIPGYEEVCAGLYTYTVEEFGKILYLKSFSLSPSDSNKTKFPYKMKGGKKGTGFLNHYKKFDLALDVLPDTCKILCEGGGFLASGFLSSGFITDDELIADFEARKRVFFADFKRDTKISIEEPPKVTKALLEKAVEKFLCCMRNETSS